MNIHENLIEFNAAYKLGPEKVKAIFLEDGIYKLAIYPFKDKKGLTLSFCEYYTGKKLVNIDISTLAFIMNTFSNTKSVIETIYSDIKKMIENNDEDYQETVKCHEQLNNEPKFIGKLGAISNEWRKGDRND